MRARVRFALFSFALVLGLGGIVCGCKSADESAPAPVASASTTTPAPASVSASNTSSVDGTTIFKQNCSGCHGDKGVGGKRAPVLAGEHTPEAETVKVVTDGKGQRMPSFKSRLTGAQIEAVAKYVATL